MDRASFDRIARTLAGAATRRDGFKALIGAAVAIIGAGGGAVVDAAPNGPAKRRAERAGASKKPSAKGKPSTQGPCGSGKRKDNICTKDSDCCTGICNLGAGKKNKDRRGRCRCMKRNKPCTADANCCNTLTCNQGRCSLFKPTTTPVKPAAKVPTGSGCTLVDTCASDQASCTIYASNEPRGSYCLLPNGATCTSAKQCVGQACNGGVCAAGLIPTGHPCTGGDTCANAQASCVAYGSSDPAGTYCLLPNDEACDSASDCVSQICPNSVCVTVLDVCDVCQTCTYTTVQAAIDGMAAGATIAIGEGEYIEDLTIEKDLTLKACNGAAVTLANATDGRRVISRVNNDTLVSLTITGITVDRNDSFAVGGGISGWYNLTLNGVTTVRNGVSEHVGSGIELGSGNFDVDWENDIWNDGTAGECTLTLADKAQVTDCLTGSNGGGIWMGCKGGNLIIRDRASVTSSAAGYRGGAIWTAENVIVTLQDQAFIGGNHAYAAGAICTGDRCKVRMSGSAAVLGNRADDDGGGISIDSYSELDLSGQALIAENTSGWDGGGVHCRGCYECTAVLSDDSELRDNTAALSGGGMYMQGMKWDGEGPFPQVLSMKGNAKIHGNSTDRDGGGVYAYDQGEILLADQASIFNNTSSGSGGGVYTAGDVTLKGTSSIRNNEAANSGGGVFLRGDDPEYITNPTEIKLKVAAAAKVAGNTPDQCDSSGVAAC